MLHISLNIHTVVLWLCLVNDVAHFWCHHPIGITVNALAPAVVRTAMVEAMNPTQVKYMTDKIPMQR